MRLLHVADTHVGYSAYHRVDANGLNQREQDVLDAFRQVVDLALTEEVDAVVHAGDLFDSVRPSNRATAAAMAELRRLGDAGIPTVVIGGNHETPKLRETGSVLRFLTFLPHVHAVFRGHREVVRLAGGDLAVHAVPHAPSREALEAEIDAAEPLPDARWNVLVLHVGVPSIPDFRGGEFNELVIPTSLLREDHDYVALGHYHRCTRVRANAWYAGSTERFGFGEVGQDKGVLLVDLDDPENPAFHPLDIRPMVDLPPLDCGDLKDDAVPPALYDRLRSVEPAGKLLRLKVRNLPRHVYTGLDFQLVKQLTEGAVHAQVDYDVVDADHRIDAGTTRIGSLAAELRDFLETAPLEDLDREALEAEALAFLEQAQGVET